ncbi:unnamed protein product [Caenorhabditis bovis]|uniref:AAA+ ATPase domain-containing protein n=1 Tax=Caenorhabditis bovis TaxID=2654633 RepID=A0A8S1F4N8_9PELO|nr:unnamed protein product [Caenorhabditis bovis]
MSSKKKPQIVVCQVCQSTILAKDSARHADFCNQELEKSEIPIIKSTTLIGFNSAVENSSCFLPPDSLGWEKAHAVLMSSQTMEAFDLLPRQPIRVTFGEKLLIGVVYPCNTIPLLKLHILSPKIPRERLVKVQKYGRVEKVSNLSVRVEATKIESSLKDFLEMYLSYAFLEFNNPITLKYLGRFIEVTAEEGLERKIEKMGLADGKEDISVISPISGYSLNILNQELSKNSETRPTNLENVDGMFGAKKILTDYVINPISRNQEPCSILLWGLPGSGKTYILRHLEAVLGPNAIFISAFEDLAELKIAQGRQLLILDINEIDKENNNAMKSLRNVLENEGTSVILSIRSPDNLDIGYRVRFPVEVEVTVPTQDERIDVLQKLLKDFGFESGIELDVARITHGFTNGDLRSLLKAAKYCQGTSIEQIEAARKLIRPTGIRQFILEVPTVKWSDIGGNDDLKLDIQQAVIWPHQHPEAFERFGIQPPAGILLYGPPGCSKTLIARALANEAKMNFLAVKGPELFSKWVGDSEKAIRELFARARHVAPTIVFFDEIDAVGSARGSDKSSAVSDRVLAQLLTELDGLEKSSRVILLAATNRPDQLDGALLRPGRLDRAIYVGLPCQITRRAIIEMSTRKMEFEKDDTIEKLVDMTDGYSGAELVALCRTAAMFAMRQDMNTNFVRWSNFEQAFTAVRPRTERHLIEIYEEFRLGATSGA